MLGFLKKKKKKVQDEDGSVDTKAASQSAKGEDAGKPPEPPGKKKKKRSFKKLIFILLILAALGGSGFFVYTSYFASPPEGTRVYTPVPLAHVDLPQEMLAFTFAHFPGLYDAMVAYNREVDLFDGEIRRIEAVAAQYPEQKKIADTQKKVWEKGKTALVKSFEKLEKPVKETYVLYQVNNTRGQEQISARGKDLTDAAQEALTKAQEQTATLKERAPKPPEGMVQGTIYKIKKIFL